MTGRLLFETGPPYSATYRWRDGHSSFDGHFEPIYLNPNRGDAYSPTDISGDGSVITALDATKGVRWREEVGEIEVWETATVPLISAYGVSDDGEIIVGTSDPAGGELAFQWMGDTTTQLPIPPDPPFLEPSATYGISPDGSVIVGYAVDPGPPRQVAGALWRDGVLEWRAFPLQAASWDGTFLLGYDSDDHTGRFFDASGDAHRLVDLLSELGVQVPDAPDESLRVTAMSYDGHVVIGTLVRPGQRIADYQAVLAPKLGIDIQPRSRANRVDLRHGHPIVVRVYGSEQADADDIDPGDLRFGPARARPLGARPARDYNRDGFPDRDFLFDPVASGLAIGDREACLAGGAADLPFRLCSRVRPTLGGRP